MKAAAEPAPPRAAAAVHDPRWLRTMGRRVGVRLWLKALGITAFMWPFFAVYFHLLRHPGAPVFVMPLTALDHAIVFQPAAMWAYVSLWFYVGIPVGLMVNLRDALLYGVWATALCAAGLLLFWLLPTAVPPGQVPADAASYPGFALLQGIDAAGNACPSMHVASATFSAFWIRRLLLVVGTPRWVHAANWLWLLLIVHSTLATKQHVALDALAGGVLALLFVVPSLRWPAGLGTRPAPWDAGPATGAAR